MLVSLPQNQAFARQKFEGEYKTVKLFQTAKSIVGYKKPKILDNRPIAQLFAVYIRRIAVLLLRAKDLDDRKRSISSGHYQ